MAAKAKLKPFYIQVNVARVQTMADGSPRIILDASEDFSEEAKRFWDACVDHEILNLVVYTDTQWDLMKSNEKNKMG